MKKVIIILASIFLFSTFLSNEQKIIKDNKLENNPSQVNNNNINNSKKDKLTVTNNTKSSKQENKEKTYDKFKELLDYKKANHKNTIVNFNNNTNTKSIEGENFSFMVKYSYYDEKNNIVTNTKVINKGSKGILGNQNKNNTGVILDDKHSIDFYSADGKKKQQFGMDKNFSLPSDFTDTVRQNTIQYTINATGTSSTPKVSYSIDYQTKSGNLTSPSD